MLGTGKYSFPRLRKAGAAALRVVLASTSFGRAFIASPFHPLLDPLLKWLAEWLANRGLLIINIGSIYVNGEFDQKRFDRAMEEGLEKAKAPNLSDSQKRVIDAAVIDAFRRFAHINNRL
jgi:hypothetical protein